jgi:Flp pilus assembly protein TadD
LVFARAPATEPYPAGRKLAERANDPSETSIQYDLYRIAFDGGKGGRAEPIVGASRNGMSNSFPKVSPDGRWIVFVECRNGLLMRPDSQLYIVPARGGKARRMRANTSRMNSWHSFSPNGRWLVFSSKARSPYTQMYLTHVDKHGRDSPPILVENATAANRAVNIPEFVNVPPGGLLKIDVPAVEMYRLFDQAWDLTEKGKHEAAIAGWRKVLELSASEPKAHMNLGVSLARTGKLDEAIEHQHKALELDPEYPEAHMNLGVALAAMGRWEDAIRHCRMALELDPEYAEAHSNLGAALAGKGQFEEAIAHYRKALAVNPSHAEVHSNLGVALARTGKLEEAVPHFQKAAEMNPGSPDVHSNLAVAYAQAGRFEEALEAARRALALAVETGRQALAEALKARIAVYEGKSGLGTGPPPRR